MMEADLLLILSLLLAVSLLSMVSNKLRIAYPIFLVVAGLIIGIIPDIPNVSLEPEIVFVIFLPPLLYSAAWNTAWRDFRANLKPIAFLAIGLVFFTSCIIAYLSHAIIPDFTLSLGFVLGGIISPPDAVAATSIIKKLKVPKRVVTILEGESLVNDASSLIVFNFALAAVQTGQFDFWRATVDFFLKAGGGIFIGLLIGSIVYLIYRFLPTDSITDTAISLISPYIMYLTAEHFKCSGVLAVVSGGLFLTHHSNHFLNFDSRLQLNSVWNTIVFLLNGTVFILIGMQIPFILEGMENYSAWQAIDYALIISVASVLIRILWVFPGTYLPRLLSRKPKSWEKAPSAKSIFIIAWSGMRGVVSLAAAFTIPVLMINHEVFPHRNLILFITFSVILFTLVFQGLSLPFLIRVLKVDNEDGANQSLQLQLTEDLAQTVIGHIEENYKAENENNEVYKRLHTRYLRLKEEAQSRTSEGQEMTRHNIKRFRVLLLEVIKVQRKKLEELREKDTFPDEMLRSKENELDLEEARIRKINT